MSDKTQSQDKPAPSEEEMARQRREARETAAAKAAQQTDREQDAERSSNKTDQ